MPPNSSRRFLADRSTVLKASANSEYRPAELLQLLLLYSSMPPLITDCRPCTAPLVS